MQRLLARWEWWRKSWSWCLQPKGRPAHRLAHAQVEPLEDRRILTVATGIDAVLDWNNVLLETIRAERTAPPVAARNLTMMHTAVFDAVNSISGGYRPFIAAIPDAGSASELAAVAGAAVTVLSSLYPQQISRFNTAYTATLADVPDGQAEYRGVAVGQLAAQAVLLSRADDGSSSQITYVPGTDPRDFDYTGTGATKAILPQWPGVTPFTLQAANQFRSPAPPDVFSVEYVAAWNEVRTLGAATGSLRTADQTEIAQFWAAGGGTATPPGMWNQIAQTVARHEGYGTADSARLFALLNLATADAGIAAWDVKYTYNEWRPVAGIRRADTDGNPITSADPTWTSLLTTPAHPSYVSGHSTFSSAAATILSRFTGSDQYALTVASDDIPGVTRSFTSFSGAAAEAGQSRIYGGIHWQYDNQRGLELGGNVGRWVFDRTLQSMQFTPMYRVAHPEFGWHLFTTSEAEFHQLVAWGYRDESSGQTGFSVCAEEDPGSSALYRLYNPNNGAHYYTTSGGERNFLSNAGWRDEGHEGYVYLIAMPGSLPIHRLYNTQTGRHLFTVNTAERDLVMNAWPGVWQDHGIVGYAMFRTENVVATPATSRPAASAPVKAATETAPESDESPSVAASLVAVTQPTITAAPLLAASEPESDDLFPPRRVDEDTDTDVLDLIFTDEWISLVL